LVATLNFPLGRHSQANVCLPRLVGLRRCIRPPATCSAFIRRSDFSRFVPANLAAFADLCHDADEKMFAAITSDRHHVLHHLLPPQSTGSQNYNLRQRTHTFALEIPSRSGHLTDNNFIQRMLYFDVY